MTQNITRLTELNVWTFTSIKSPQSSFKWSYEHLAPCQVDANAKHSTFDARWKWNGKNMLEERKKREVSSADLFIPNLIPDFEGGEAWTSARDRLYLQRRKGRSGRFILRQSGAFSGLQLTWDRDEVVPAYITDYIKSSCSLFGAGGWWILAN